MLDDLLSQMNEQYEEFDSKEEVKEEKVDVEEIYKVNDATLKWLEDEREYLANSKDESLGKGAFKKRDTSSYQKNSKSKDDEKKDEKSSSYSRYSGYSSYSSSKDSKKDPEEEYYEKMEKKFNDKLTRMLDSLFNTEMNIANGECNWDVLDWQYELNRKRVHDRYYMEEHASKEVVKKIEKYAAKCYRKIDIAEILLTTKENPRG